MKCELCKEREQEGTVTITEIYRTPEATYTAYKCTNGHVYSTSIVECERALLEEQGKIPKQ